MTSRGSDKSTDRKRTERHLKSKGEHNYENSQRTRRTVLQSMGAFGVGAFAICFNQGLQSPQPTSSSSKYQKGESERAEQAFNENMLIGIYDESDPHALHEGNQFAQWLGRGIDVQNIFIPWDDGRYEFDELFDQMLPGLWNRGREPMLTWELSLSSGPTPDDILTKIANGRYDSYIKEWTGRLNQAASADKRETSVVYLRLGHEMNGNWYPWAPAGGSGTPEEYINMWKHVHSEVENQVASNVDIKLVWATNSTDIGEYAMEELYPGDEYVDWLAIDAYNWGEARSWASWHSPDELFSKPLQRLKSIGDHPIAVTEVGSSSMTTTGPDIERKSDWITEAFAVFSKFDVAMCLWFNYDKETDWAVFGGSKGDQNAIIDGQKYNAYSAFRRAVRKYS